MKFYAIATTQANTSVRINFDDMDKQPQSRFQAEQIAQAYCKKNDLTYEDAVCVDGTQKQGSTLTKFAKYRKQNGGKNPTSYSKAL